MDGEFVEITLKVPAERVGEFYSMVGTWMTASPNGSVSRGWRTGNPWRATDTDDAARFLAAVSPVARRILILWANSAGQWTSAEDTARAVGVAGPKGVAGSLSSVGKAADKAGRSLPFEHEAGYVGEAGRYRMTPLVAELFASAAREIEL